MKVSKNHYCNHLRTAYALLCKKGKGKKISGIQRVVSISIQAFILLSPSLILKGIADLCGKRKGLIEIYAISKPILFSLVLLLSWSDSFVWFIIVCYLLIETHAYLLGQVLLRRFWGTIGSIERSIALLLVNLAEIILAYSVIYLHAGSIGIKSEQAVNVITDPLNAIYFSFVTMTTLGDVDFTPMNEIGKITIMLQVTSALIFITIFLGAFIGGFSTLIKERNR